ncbi:MAG: polyprenyl synthetase family protein, partial [Bacteriovoracaceae bacterium]
MQNLENKLLTIFKSRVENDQLGQILEYAMFPAGKLFRPKLVLALAQDLGEALEDHYLLSAAIEAHHAYSLVHDDLPCMDDDNVRRGRPSVHKQFGEWQALLAGDGLINLSYQLLSEMSSPEAARIIRNFAQMMGAKGLILGQFIDLSRQEKTFSDTLLMHELKTSRLIQFSLLGSLVLSGEQKNLAEDEALELGKIIGVNFQLLDDLAELAQETSEHEGEVNAFLNYTPTIVVKHICQNNERILQLTKDKRLKLLYTAYSGYIEKTFAKLAQNQKKVLNRTGLTLADL